MSEILNLLLCAFGNRAWGHGPAIARLSFLNGRFYGVIITAFGLWLGKDYPVYALPLLGAAYWGFRLKSPHKWWKTFQRNEWSAAFGRALWITPLVLLLCILNRSAMPLAVGLLAVPAIPAAYWAAVELCAWIKKKTGRDIEPVSVGELFVGAILWVVSAQ